MFRGYFKNPEATEASIDADGWFHSGDIGFVRADNHAVQVIDRIKNIFKLSQGEYIAVEKVENVYLQNELVDQICVYGDSTQNYIVAVVVPKKAKLVDLVQQSTLEDSVKQKCFEDLCANHEVRQLVLSELNKTALEAKVGVVRSFDLVVRLRACPKHPSGAHRVVRQQQHSLSFPEDEAPCHSGDVQGNHQGNVP